MNGDKAIIRKEIKELQCRFSAGEQESFKILNRLECMQDFMDAKTVLLYMDLPGEVMMKDFATKWCRSKVIAIPCVSNNGSDMELRRFLPGKLHRGYMNILEADEDCERLAEDAIDFAVIPGLAFSKAEDGGYYRLGRGRGFYDRLIPRLRCRTAGVCYPFCVLDSIPHDDMDAKVDICLF